MFQIKSAGHVPVCRRSLSRVCLEETDEMLGIFEAETLADYGNGQFFIVKQLFGMGEKMVGDDVLGGTTSLHTHQISEISARQTAFICKIRYRGQPFAKGFRGDVIIKECHEFPNHRMVDLLAGDELAVVEAEAIVQQQLYVGNDEFASMLVDGAMQFLLYHGEHTPKDLHLLGGKMQSLGAGITEELVAVYLSA